MRRLEDAVNRLSGERRLARRIRMEAKKGASANSAAFNNFEQAVAKRRGDPKFVLEI